jgi:hypothetical protein
MHGCRGEEALVVQPSVHWLKQYRNKRAGGADEWLLDENCDAML